jgi:hypothetical protein
METITTHGVAMPGSAWQRLPGWWQFVRTTRPFEDR